MKDGSLNRLEDLLAEALELPPEDREAFLDRTCNGDTALRSEMAELLSLHDEAEDFFDGLSGDIAAAAPLELESASHTGLAIGPYRTLAAIGQGGMGAVYRAERVDGAFEQEVALKLLHRDMDTPELRARFLAERQLLAELSHPNIARLAQFLLKHRPQRCGAVALRVGVWQQRQIVQLEVQHRQRRLRLCHTQRIHG